MGRSAAQLKVFLLEMGTTTLMVFVVALMAVLLTWGLN